MATNSEFAGFCYDGKSFGQIAAETNLAFARAWRRRREASEAPETTGAGEETRAVASTLPSECLASPVRARPLGDPAPRRTNPLVHPHYARGSWGTELVSLRADEK